MKLVKNSVSSSKASFTLKAAWYVTLVAYNCHFNLGFESIETESKESIC